MSLTKLQSLKYFFITSLLLSNIIASKIISFGGFILPAAVIFYPLTFLFSDVVAEIEGKESAHELVMTGFYMSLLMLFILFIGQILPAAPFWKHQEAYNLILGATPRIVFASMTAYLVSQNYDIWAFHWWKEKTAGKHLWLRNNFSTMTSQLIDSVIFIVIAFGGIYPLATIGIMILSQYAVKVALALFDTPFCYLLVRVYANNREQIQGA